MRSRSRCRGLAVCEPERNQSWTIASAVPPVLLLAGRRRQNDKINRGAVGREGTDVPARCGALGGRHSLTADPNPREWRWAMFINRATLRNFNHRLGRSVVRDLRASAPRDLATVRPCNDNQGALSTALFRRTRRPTLSCRWRLAPGGTLECVWHTDTEAASAGEEPGLCRLDESLRQSDRHCGFAATINVAGKLHCGVNPSERLDSPRGSFLNSTRSGASICCPRNCQRRATFPMPLGFAGQRRKMVTTCEPEDLPERRHPTVARDAHMGRVSAAVTHGIVTRLGTAMRSVTTTISHPDSRRRRTCSRAARFAAACAAFLYCGERAVHAADLSGVLPTKAPPPPSAPAAYDWTGLHVGAHLGYATGSSDWTATQAGSATPSLAGSLDLFNGFNGFGATGSYLLGLQAATTTCRPRDLSSARRPTSRFQICSAQPDNFIPADRPGELSRPG
jgi:hypothetical protein